GPGREALILVGHPAPSRRDPDFYAFNLLNQVLGGNSITSRLAVRLRDQERLALSVESRVVPMAGGSAWAVVARVEPDKVDRALAAIREEMERMRTLAPSEEEVTRARSALEGRLQVAQSSGAGRAELLASLEFYRLAETYGRDFAGLYERIAPRELLGTAKLRLHPDHLVTLVVSPR
ncbi:MAG: insulinase family protein, partial [Candidatus Eremiobacterota bacterium]